MRLMLQNGAIWGLIALFLTNQNAGNTIDFKMNVINNVNKHINTFIWKSNGRFYGVPYQILCRCHVAMLFLK